MHVLVAYDISDNKQRGKLSAYLEEKGIRSQKSVFECELENTTLQEVYAFVRRLDLEEHDSVLFYPLCKRCARQVRILGQGLRLVQTDWMVI